MSKGSILNQQIEIPKNPATIASNVSYNNSATSSIITGKNVQQAIDQLFTSVSNGKKKIASAITDKGVSTSENDSFDTMANKISSINVQKTQVKTLYSNAEGNILDGQGFVSFTLPFRPSDWIIFKSDPGRLSGPGSMFFYAKGYSCYSANGSPYNYSNVETSGNTVTVKNNVYGGSYLGMFVS